jgi:hypothetical protein
VEAGAAVARFAAAVLCAVLSVPRWPVLARAAVRECRSRQAAKKGHNTESPGSEWPAILAMSNNTAYRKSSYTVPSVQLPSYFQID